MIMAIVNILPPPVFIKTVVFITIWKAKYHIIRFSRTCVLWNTSLSLRNVSVSVRSGSPIAFQKTYDQKFPRLENPPSFPFPRFIILRHYLVSPPL